MDIINTREMSRDEITGLLDRAEEIEESEALSDKVLALLFFEPSTRTRMSFDTAMKRLGGDTVDMSSKGTQTQSSCATRARALRASRPSS